MLHNYYMEKPKDVQIYTYGIENNSDFMAEDIVLSENKSRFVCNFKGDKFEVTVPVGGIHFVYNALCAIAVGNLLNLSTNQIVKGIETFELTKKSFESMQASLKYLGEFKNRRKVAILGDMFELGEFSKELHENVGKEVVKNKIDLLICSGENSKAIAEAAQKAGMDSKNVFYFDKKDEIVEFILKNFNKNEAILLKASNGMRFLEIAEALIKNANY